MNSWVDVSRLGAKSKSLMGFTDEKLSPQKERKKEMGVMLCRERCL
jgi:hypothetical protein